MTTIKGRLEPYSETGTEGIIWSVYKENGEGYDGLYLLRNGDYLTIFDPADVTKVVWEGNIDLEFQRNYIPYPMNPKYGQQTVHGCWVHGFQRNVQPEDWGMWFIKLYPCELVEGKIGHLYRCKSSLIEGHRWSGSLVTQDKDSASNVGDLILKFSNSACYRYKDVDYETYSAFEASESKGKYFAANIKGKFITEKIEPAVKPFLKPTPGAKLNPPRPWKKYPQDHGSDVAKAWPFPTSSKP